MKKCPYCGAVNSDNSKSCYSCKEKIDFEISEERKKFVSGDQNVIKRQKKKDDNSDNPAPLSAGCSRAIEVVVALLITGIVTSTFKLGALPAVLVLLASFAIGEAVANIFRK